MSDVIRVQNYVNFERTPSIYDKKIVLSNAIFMGEGAEYMA